MKCEYCGQEVDGQGISRTHCFSGYGYYNVYHPECCPRECDGTGCDLDHPEDVPPRAKVWTTPPANDGGENGSNP